MHKYPNVIDSVNVNIENQSSELTLLEVPILSQSPPIPSQSSDSYLFNISTQEVSAEGDESFRRTALLSINWRASLRNSSLLDTTPKTRQVDDKDLLYIEVAICDKYGEQVSKLYVDRFQTTKELEAQIIEKRKMDISKWKLIGELMDGENILFEGTECVDSFFNLNISRRSLLGGKREQLQRFKLVSVEQFSEICKDEFSEKRRSARDRVIKINSTFHVTPDLTQGVLEKRGFKNKS